MDIQQLLSRGFSLEKLNSFLKVARAESITAAADGSQSRRSLMSRQISELEKTLGAELFYRNKKKLVLTEFGRSFALTTATYFNEIEDLLSVENKERRILKIGAGGSIFEALVFPKLKKLQEQFPKTQFDFVSRSTNGILEAIKTGELDAGIVRSDIPSSGFRNYDFGALEFICVARKDFHKLVDTWSLRQFLDRAPIAIISGNGRFVSSFNQMCRELELSPRIEATVGSFGQVRDLIVGGCPGGLLPRAMAEKLDPSHFSLIEEPPLEELTRSLSLVIDERVARVRDGMEQKFQSFTKIIADT